ncbi:sensor domain-containing diguanylate cyclase [Natronincola peptidivorans]|nr:sensor domain-containing diguanylate cyclase [Natronincola peptidivorans]
MLVFSLMFLYIVIFLLSMYFLPIIFNQQYGFPMFLLISVMTFGICYFTYQYASNYVNAHRQNHEKTKEIMESILEISDSILTIKDKQQLFQLILEKAVQCIDDADLGSLLILKEDNLLEYKALVGYDKEKFKNLQLKLEDSFLYRYNHGDTSQSCIIRDVQQYDKNHLSQDTYEELYHADGFITKTALSTPIKVDNKLYGIINVDSKNLHGFTDLDMSFMEYFANQITTVIKNQESLDKLLYLLKHDNLTNIYNRYYFEEIFDDLLDRAERYNESFAIAMFDLDNLKITNDTLGHQRGDLLIQQFAQGLKSTVRKTDIVARYGGDEFVAVFLYADFQTVISIINNLHAYFINHPVVIEDAIIANEFSYGIAHYPSDGTKRKELLKIADTRMYLNKHHHKQ